MKTIMGALLTLCLASASVCAHTLDSLKAGDQIRLNNVRYKLEGIHGDTLTVRSAIDGVLQDVRIADVITLDVKVGHRPLLRALAEGGGIGLFIGGGFGFLYGVVTGEDPECIEVDATDHYCPHSFKPVERGARYAAAFGGAGVLVGGIIGVARSGDRWQKVDVPNRVSMRPAWTGAPGIEVSIAF
jgi:hypothetical protein